MEDTRIINLFFAREEAGIQEAKHKYGRSLHKVAYNILSNNHDAEEAVNDTLLRAWDAIPPKKPEYLGAYLSKITRNLSLKRWKAGSAAKRGGGQADLLLSELGESVPQQGSVEGAFEYNQTVNAINSYLRNMDASSRIIFVRRYFYGDSIQDICNCFRLSDSKVKSMLFRARKKLKLHLEKEGVTM